MKYVFSLTVVSNKSTIHIWLIQISINLTNVTNAVERELFNFNFDTIPIQFLMKFTKSAAKVATPKHYINPGNLLLSHHLSSKSSPVKVLEASWKMKVLAFALLAFAISANASSISCGPSKTDCKEPEPVELCTYQKTCKNVCHNVVSFMTDFKMKKKCHKECVQRTREVPCTIKQEKCEEICVTKYKTVHKERYVLNWHKSSNIFEWF